MLKLKCLECGHVDDNDQFELECSEDLHCPSCKASSVLEVEE